MSAQPLNTLQARDLSVTVYSIASFAQAVLLYQNAREFYNRRNLILGLVTAGVAFGLVSALVSWAAVAEFTDKSIMCVVKKPIAATMHMLSRTACELTSFIKVRAVNQGKERNWFTGVMVFVLAARIIVQALNSANGETKFIPATKACTVAFSPYAIPYNIGVVIANLVFGAMFVYPIRKQLKMMASIGGVGTSSTQSEMNSSHQAFANLVKEGVLYAVFASLFATIMYSLVVVNILGNATPILVYIDWTVMLFCTTRMVTFSASKRSQASATVKGGSQNQSQSRQQASKVVRSAADEV